MAGLDLKQKKRNESSLNETNRRMISPNIATVPHSPAMIELKSHDGCLTMIEPPSREMIESETERSIVSTVLNV